MRIRALRHEDVDPVLAILRASFASELRRYFTRTQRGAEALYHAALDNRDLVPTIDLTVAVNGDGSPLGFAEFTQKAESAHLSYICIADAARRTGLATSLIEAYVERRQPSTLSLDVFADNEGAVQLYRKLGFTVREEDVWLRRRLPPPTTALPVTNGYEAMAMRTLFAFCTLEVPWNEQTSRIGWLGDDVLRCTDPGCFEDDEFLSSMAATVRSATEAILITNRAQSSRTPEGVDVLARSLRMVKATAPEAATS